MNDMKLYISSGDGKYVPFDGIRDVGEIEYPNCDAEELKRAMQEVREKLDARPNFDTVLMNDGLMMQLLFRQLVTVDGKEFRYDGMRVMTSPEIPYDKVYITDYEHAIEIIEMLNGKSTEGDSGDTKKDAKVYHCRVCGTGYESKAEAKQCQRKHDWQNRKARR